jgi:ribulose-phosphate 3-epimerase
MGRPRPGGAAAPRRPGGRPREPTVPPTRRIRFAPSILDADFGHLAEQIALVEDRVEWLHLDIMDGHFVPNLSIGVPVVASVRHHTRLFLDAHLMVTDPGRYAEPFVAAGAQAITFHIEVTDEPPALIRQIRGLGATVGVSLNPGTPAEAVYPVLADVDLVLVMTVWPGFGGQKLMAECLGKIAALAERMRPEQVLQVDGGINLETVPAVVSAGANMLVAGSAIFRAAEPRAALAELQRVADAAAVAAPERHRPV